MDLPKIVYDDFYKFLMSLGTVLFVTSVGGIFVYNSSSLNISLSLLVILNIFFAISILIMICAGKKWYQNQKLLDRRLRAEVKLIKQGTQKIVQPISEDIADNNNSALVDYRIASVLPGTVYFDFLKDHKVWFNIQNQEKKKYKAYVKIKFISSDREEDISEGYYGGAKAWNLNALSQIMAPGLEIPDWAREKAKRKERIEIRVFCDIKDENDNMIEKKLPAGFVYDYEKNNWYYEP